MTLMTFPYLDDGRLKSCFSGFGGMDSKSYRSCISSQTQFPSLTNPWEVGSLNWAYCCLLPGSAGFSPGIGTRWFSGTTVYVKPGRSRGTLDGHSTVVPSGEVA